MFGTKIRSWMEAHIVRPRKKQHRKDAAAKKRIENGLGKDIAEPSQSTRSTPQVSIATVISTAHDTTLTANGRPAKDTLKSEQARTQYQRQHNSNNLSSPESAYSTGYSTDGTSPGASFPAATPAPEYYINIRTGTRYFHSSSSDVPLRLLLPGVTSQQSSAGAGVSAGTVTTTTASVEPTVSTGRIASPALTSPRQRNRIRTNPWVTTTTVGCNCSPMHVGNPRQPVPTLQQQKAVPVGSRAPQLVATASPVRRKWGCGDKKQRCLKCGACSRFEAFSSSSSSSLSVSSVHRAAPRPVVTGGTVSDDEDDRTLNEMMGKYDESYVYEKETDILSDSDPTDCDEEYDDTDAEAGRDGGDEQDPLTDEDDFDFIDNGSLELNVAEENDSGLMNKGHCTYHNFQEEEQPAARRQSNRVSSYRKATGVTPTTGRRRKPSERRSRHASSKKRRDRAAPFAEQPTVPAPVPVRMRPFPNHLDGFRSAGNTPVSVRRRRAALSEREQTPWISKSVDKQRRNSVSHPRRPTRAHPDALCEVDKEADKKYRELIIEAEHILMAMRTSSPPVTPARRATVGPANKRVELLRNAECGTVTNSSGAGGGGGGGGGGSGGGTSLTTEMLQVTCDVTSVKFSPKRNHITNFMNNNSPVSISSRGKSGVSTPVAASPRRAPLLAFKPSHLSLQQHCPQSEPVKRKVYAPVVPMDGAGVGAIDASAKCLATDSSNFQRQKLFQTITSLKRNLENQSETLRHAYHFGSNHRLSLTSQHL